MVKKRNYRKEYDEFHGLSGEIKKRAARNRARRLLKMAGRIWKRSQEADHKKSLKKGGGTGLGNVQVLDRSANRKKGSK